MTTIRFADFNSIAEDDIAVLEHLITAEDVRRFAELTGDTNPLHLDESFARRTKFRSPIAHGMLGASFISTVIGTLLPGNGALWLGQTLDFRSPIRVGDNLKIQVRVKHKSPSQRLLVLETLILNQHSETVTAGEAKVKLLEELKENIVDTTKASVALVTGSGRGIGAAIAKRLATDGLKVVVNYVHNQERAEQVVTDIETLGGKAISVKADITSERDVQKLFKCAVQTFGEVDVLVNNATVSISSPPFEQIDWVELLRHLEIHVKGALLCSQQVLPHMITREFGRIVNIGSVAIDNVPPLQQLGYVVAKSALVGLSKSLAVEFGPKGITVNVVSPGMTATELISDVSERTSLTLKMQTPLRRLAQPEDVADVVSFLVSPDARFITGETIHVCGGQMMF